MQSINNYLLSNTNRTDVFLSLAESADSAEISFWATIKTPFARMREIISAISAISARQYHTRGGFYRTQKSRKPQKL
jgi:hypothetical protein